MVLLIFLAVVFVLLVAVGVLGVLLLVIQLENIMSIENLKVNVDNLATVSAEGFAAQASALEELRNDILNMVSKDDINAEAERIAGITATIRDNASATAQAIRDAIPTEAEAPAEPEVPAEEVPAEEAPASEEPTGEPTEGDDPVEGEGN